VRVEYCMKPRSAYVNVNKEGNISPYWENSFLLVTLYSKYCMSQRSWPMLYNELLYKMGQDFLDIQYIEQLNPESSEVELMIKFLDLKKMFFRTKNSFRSKLQKKHVKKADCKRVDVFNSFCIQTQSFKGSKYKRPHIVWSDYNVYIFFQF